MKRASKTVIGPEGNPIQLENWEEKKATAELLTEFLKAKYPGQKVIEIPEQDQWIGLKQKCLVTHPEKKEWTEHYIAKRVLYKRGKYTLFCQTERGETYNYGLEFLNDEAFVLFADYFMPQQEIVHPDHLPIYGESATYGDLMPGTYLCLFHGFHNEIDRKRNTINDNGLGTAGPMIGPLDFVHTTYAFDIKIRFASGFYESKEKYGLDAESQLDMADDCVLYNGVQYGDWSVTNYPFPSY